jgi:hypothetical protein
VQPGRGVDSSLDGRVYHRELERVRIRIALALHRADPAAPPSRFDELRDAMIALEAELAADWPASRAQRLAERLGLLDDEIDLLWTAVGVAADPRVSAQARVLGGSELARGIPLAVHTLIAGHDGRQARMLLRRLLAPNPLLDDGLLVWSAEADLAPAARPLVAPPRTIAWLGGVDGLDDDLRGAGMVVPVPVTLELDPSQRGALAELRAQWATATFPLIAIEGAAGSGRRTAVAVVAAEHGQRVVALDLRRLAPDERVIEAAMVALRRECRLRDAAALIANVDELVGGGERTHGAMRVLARGIDAWRGPIAITTSAACTELLVARAPTRIRWTVPDVATRRRLWQRALGGAADPVDHALDDLSARYALGAGGVARAAATADVLAGGGPVTEHHLVEGVRANIAERLGDLAVHQPVRHGWDDLVLAPDLLDQVTALIGRVRHAHLVLNGWGFASKVARGGGVAALFSGPPGTGKTMVAGVIARELGLELYQVDLSKVVSKWVGETEKQLARVFAAADAGHALLLFDEADALFARRTEVSSSVDRYANLEVNYLLQRIESFAGVTILTTNFDTSIDPALRRRLAASVVFWPPDVEERTRLWQSFLPRAVPRARDLDVEMLADRYPEMTGANIRNAVVAGAFLAAAEASPITQAHLERGARGEYIAMGRVISSPRRM